MKAMKNNPKRALGIDWRRTPKYVRRVQAEWIVLAEKALRG